MAPDTEERRSDTVAVSRSSLKVVTGLVTALILGIATVLWNIVIDHVRLVERVGYLEEFGPKRGDRFTAGDGKELKSDFLELKRWVLEQQKNMNAHSSLGEHPFAGRRLNSLEVWIKEHEQKEHSYK